MKSKRIEEKLGETEAVNLQTKLRHTPIRSILDAEIGDLNGFRSAFQTLKSRSAAQFELKLCAARRDRSKCFQHFRIGRKFNLPPATVETARFIKQYQCQVNTPDEFTEFSSRFIHDLYNEWQMKSEPAKSTGEFRI